MVPAGRFTAALAVLLAAVAALLACPGLAAAAGPSAPVLPVRAAALMDADTGQILYADHGQEELAIASTTKLMTALITLEREPLGRVFTEPDFSFAADDSQIGLLPGERMSVHDLLLAMLLPSADDAALDLADNVGGGSVDRFLALMNARAAQLGLRHTHYTTPIGLDTAGNYSSAEDLLTLARYDLSAEPFFRRAVAQTSAVLRTGKRVLTVVNRNDLVGRYPWIDGVKTGHTLDAGYVLVASAHRDGMHLLSVVLGTDSEEARDLTTLSLLRWGFSNFRARTPVRAGRVEGHVPVLYRPKQPAAVVSAASFTRVFPIGTRLRTRVSLPARLSGPLPKGARVGRIQVLAAGSVVATVPLVLAQALPRLSAPSTPVARSAAAITLVSVVLLAVLARTGRFRARRGRGRAAEDQRDR